MRIQEIITELLKTTDRVVIPGLGTFEAKYEEAGIDQKDNSFTPPAKEVSFTTKYKNLDDTYIARTLETKLNITQEEALDKIHRLINEIVTTLQQNKDFNFEPLGILRKDAERGIILIPGKHENLLIDAYGFEPFIHKPKLPKTMNTAGTRKKSGKKVWIPIFGISLLLIALCFYFFNEKVRNSIDSSGFGIFVSNIFSPDHHSQEEKDNTKIGKILDEATQPENALSFEQGSDEKYAHCTQFIIVAGSFQHFKNAEKLRIKLKKQGFEPEIILSENHYYRVALRKYDNRTFALKELNKLQQENANLKIWLLSI